MFLKLRFQEFLECLFIHLLCSRYFLTSGFINRKLLRWLLILDIEHTNCLVIGARISIEDIPTVLTVVLVEAPCDRLVDQVHRHPLIWVSCTEFLQLPLDVDILIFIIRVSVYFRFNRFLYFLRRHFSFSSWFRWCE